MTKINFNKPNSYPYLILNTACIVDNSHTGCVGSNIQPLNDFGQEDLHLLKL